MESFWGKLKQKWFNIQHFKICEEANAAVLYTFGYFTTTNVSILQMSNKHGKI